MQAGGARGGKQRQGTRARRVGRAASAGAARRPADDNAARAVCGAERAQARSRSRARGAARALPLLSPPPPEAAWRVDMLAAAALLDSFLDAARRELAGMARGSHSD